MYDKSNGCSRLRKFNGLNLAWWHSYKYGITQIWKQFADEVFAPLWHNLYPKHNFFRKHGQVSVMVLHIMYLEMVYPSVKDKLHKILDDAINLQAKTKVYVMDLIFLFEIAIPVVCNYLQKNTNVHNR